MFKSLSRLFKMSKVPASTRAIAHRLRPGLQMLEDRTTPAVTYDLTGGGVLTINLQAANDTTVIEYDPASSGSYKITPNVTSPSASLTGVTSIIVRDTGTRAIGQSVTITALTGTSIGALSGGFTSTGVETVTINAAIGDSTNTGGISISAATAINISADLTTSGANAPIVLNGPVFLGAALVKIDAGTSDISFGGTINSLTTARALTVDAGTGSVIFNGALGNSSVLAAVTVTGDTEIKIGGNISTNALVTFNGPITLNRNVTIATGSGGVVFGALATDGVDSDSSGTPRQLTVTGTGAVTFNGEVGGNVPLAGMVISSSGAISVGGDVTTSGNSIVSFTGPVSLAADAVFTTTGASLTFSSTINSKTATASKLDVVVTGKGTATFGGAIGATNKVADVTITAPKIVLAGNITTDDAPVDLTGAMTLNTNVAIDTNVTSTTTGIVTLLGSINSSAGIANKDLTLDVGDADVIINANVGSIKPLKLFTVSVSETTVITNILKAAAVSISANSLINVAATAKVTATTSATLIATGTGAASAPADIIISGAFIGSAVTVTGFATAGSNLIADNNANFTVAGTGVAGSEQDGTLTRLVKGVTSTFNFTNIGALDLTGGVSANTFAFTDWKGDAAIDGGAGSDTLLVSRINETVANFVFGLTPLAVELSTGVNYDISGGSIDSVTLTGGATNDSFDIGAWILPVRINGGTGMNDVAYTGAANVTLTANKFVAGTLVASLSGISSVAITGTAASNTYTINGFRGDLTLDGVNGTDVLRVTSNSDFALDVSSLVAGVLNISNFTDIDSVFLTGGASVNTFNISDDFLGLLTLDGASNADVYNIDLPPTGVNLVVTVADSGKSGKDTLTATPTGGSLTRTGTGTSGSIFRTGDSATPKKPRIDFSGIEIITSLT